MSLVLPKDYPLIRATDFLEDEEFIQMFEKEKPRFIDSNTYPRAAYGLATSEEPCIACQTTEIFALLVPRDMVGGMGVVCMCCGAISMSLPAQWSDCKYEDAIIATENDYRGTVGNSPKDISVPYCSAAIAYYYMKFRNINMKYMPKSNYFVV